MMRVFVSLGSNIGDRENYLLNAIKLLGETDKIKVIRCSRIYETLPEGKTDQRDFLNCVVELQTFLNPADLLRTLHEIENRLGRTRTEKWSPRTIDLDILAFGNEKIETDELSIPHKLMTQRRFVLEPLMEIAPDFIVPGEQKTIKELFECVVK